MSKYQQPGPAPNSPTDFRAWVEEELRHMADAMSEIEPDTIILKQWNAEPDKLYDGLVVYADGTNWNPGSGEGVYVYYAAAWHFLG